VRAAAYFLGICYRDGYGVEQDLATAAKWYARAAEAGYADAQLALALAHLHGQGVGKNPQRAQKLFRSAAEAGIPAAQFFLGSLLANSPEDHAEAIIWISRAAEQGFPQAQTVLAELGKAAPADDNA
jgi:hypothetical protein